MEGNPLVVCNASGFPASQIASECYPTNYREVGYGALLHQGLAKVDKMIGGSNNLRGSCRSSLLTARRLVRAARSLQYSAAHHRHTCYILSITPTTHRTKLHVLYHALCDIILFVRHESSNASKAQCIVMQNPDASTHADRH
jgi:hypothetical protein